MNLAVGYDLLVRLDFLKGFSYLFQPSRVSKKLFFPLELLILNKSLRIAARYPLRIQIFLGFWNLEDEVTA